MQKLLRSALVLLGTVQAIAVFVAFEKPAHAYVDPGSGLLVLQLAGSMVAGAVFCVRYRIRRMLGFAEQQKSDYPPPNVTSAPTAEPRL